MNEYEDVTSVDETVGFDEAMGTEDVGYSNDYTETETDNKAADSVSEKTVEQPPTPTMDEMSAKFGPELAGIATKLFGDKPEPWHKVFDKDFIKNNKTLCEALLKNHDQITKEFNDQCEALGIKDEEIIDEDDTEAGAYANDDDDDSFHCYGDDEVESLEDLVEAVVDMVSNAADKITSCLDEIAGSLF